MAIRVYTEKTSVSDAFRSYGSTVKSSGDEVVVELSGRDCQVSVGEIGIRLADLLQDGICLIVQNYVDGKARIEKPLGSSETIIQRHVSRYRFEDVNSFVQSSERSWWSGDFFFTGGEFFDNYRDQELKSVWDALDIILQNLNHYGALYAVWERDTEFICVPRYKLGTLAQMVNMPA